MRRELATGEPELALIPLLADPARDFLDVGANDGVYSFAALPHFRRVFAVEAHPDLAEPLRRIIEPKGRVIAAALSDHEGVARLWISAAGRQGPHHPLLPRGRCQSRLFAARGRGPPHDPRRARPRRAGGRQDRRRRPRVRGSPRCRPHPRDGENPCASSNARSAITPAASRAPSPSSASTAHRPYDLHCGLALRRRRLRSRPPAARRRGETCRRRPRRRLRQQLHLRASRQSGRALPHPRGIQALMPEAGVGDHRLAREAPRRSRGLGRDRRSTASRPSEVAPLGQPAIG